MSCPAATPEETWRGPVGLTGWTGMTGGGVERPRGSAPMAPLPGPEPMFPEMRPGGWSSVMLAMESGMVRGAMRVCSNYSDRMGAVAGRCCSATGAA
ncbi:MAG: hypothetical protein WA476_18955, partial [Acidobacteriaceae bacterium]